jgi:hypothetical protein
MKTTHPSIFWRVLLIIIYTLKVDPIMRTNIELMKH